MTYCLLSRELPLETFSHQRWLRIFHRSFRDSKCPQFFRTLLRILADLNNAVFRMVSTCPVIFKSSSPCINPLVTVSRAPIIISIIVTFILHRFFFFNSIVRSRYLSFYSLPFNFILWSAGTANSTVLQVLFFVFFVVFLFLLLSLGLVVLRRLGDPFFVSKSQPSLCISFSSTDAGLLHIAFVRMVKFKFLARFPVDHLTHLVISSLILSLR